MAQIRATSQASSLKEAESEAAETQGTSTADIPLKHTLLTSPNVTPNKNYQDSLHSFCKDAAETLGIDVEKEVQVYNRSVRDSNPVNEFTDSEWLRCAAHPEVFMLGTSYGEKGGTLTQQRINHLLGQYTTVAACCRPFIFSELDKMQRHENVRRMKAKVQKDPKAFKAMAEEFLTPEFGSDLKKGVANPASKEGQKILAKIGPVLKAAGKKTVFGPLERYSSAGEILAMGRRFGASSQFLTLTFNDAQHPTSVRLTFRNHSNKEFPAVADEDFFKALEEGSTYCGSGEIDCSWGNLTTRITGNPVASVVAYKRVVMDILTILLGMSPANTNGDERRALKTEILDYGKVGVINGTPVAINGVNEANNRGGLHFHLLIWGGIPPHVLSAAANIPLLCEEVSKTLDAMYQSELPR